MSKDVKQDDYQGSNEQISLNLVIENYSQEMTDSITADLAARKESSSVFRLMTAIGHALRKEDLPKTRLVLTGDLIVSVNTREDRTDKKFTMERGAGIVAAKTMPPNSDGTVDILIPIHWVLPIPDSEDERDKQIQHIAAHEAVHATIFHIGDKPFDFHRHKESGYAMQNFLSMAGKQTEEYLAEFLGSVATTRRIEQTAEQVDLSFKAWSETLATELPAIPEDSPDYFYRGMMITFESLHILWKALSYLAAALRTEDGFDPTPSEIESLPNWKIYVKPWWPKYLELLDRIPLSVEIDTEKTDGVIYEMALHLQQWASDIGFDLHDTEQGPYFRIKLWDK